MCSSTEQVQDMTASLSLPPLMNRSVVKLNIMPTNAFYFPFFSRNLCFGAASAFCTRFKVCVTDKQQELKIVSLSSEILFAKLMITQFPF